MVVVQIYLIFSCSDGAGRSGVYLAIDANIELSEEDGVFDVYGYLKKMRQFRRGLIETLVSSLGKKRPAFYERVERKGSFTLGGARSFFRSRDRNLRFRLDHFDPASGIAYQRRARLLCERIFSRYPGSTKRRFDVKKDSSKEIVRAHLRFG